MKSQVLFFFYFLLIYRKQTCIQQMLGLHVLEMWSTGLASYTWVALMAGRERETSWQAENEACSSVREEALWADWLQACVREAVGLAQVSTLERACYQMVSTVNRIFLPSVCLQMKELRNGILQHLKLIFSWSHIKVAEGIAGSGRKMVIAALILVVEQTCASLLALMGLVTEVWVIYRVVLPWKQEDVAGDLLSSL